TRPENAWLTILSRSQVFGDRLGAGTDVKLVVDITDMGVNGLKGNRECICDFLVHIALGQQVEDFTFARGQRLGGRLVGPRLVKGLNDFSGDIARHRGASLMYLLDGSEDLGWRGSFDQIAVGAGFERL